jgi:hypothetical protein
VGEDAVFNLTPGPPPFSAMNSTPAASRAARMAARVGAEYQPTIASHPVLIRMIAIRQTMAATMMSIGT